MQEMQETWVRPLGHKDGPGGGHDSSLGNPVGKRSLADYTSWGCRESDPTELSLTYHVKRVHIYSILSLKKQVSQQYELYNQFTFKQTCMLPMWINIKSLQGHCYTATPSGKRGNTIRNQVPDGNEVLFQLFVLPNVWIFAIIINKFYNFFKC